MEISAYAFSSQGCRENNEDAFGYSNADLVWVVADGLGGHVGGEAASQAAVSYVMQSAKNSGRLSGNEIVSVIIGANERLAADQQANPMLYGMRTTIAAAFASDNKMRYIHVGDSRFYYFRNKKLYTQTQDHSVSQMAVQMGEINADQIRFHEDRNKLLKVLGSFDKLRIRSIDGEIAMENGDAFLLCTDGFWELILENEMETDLLDAASPQEWLEAMVARVTQRLAENSDNFTAICGFVSMPPAPVSKPTKKWTDRFRGLFTRPAATDKV